MKKILFFSRSFYADFFSSIKSDKFISLFVTLTNKEKLLIEKKGLNVIGCFESEFSKLTECKIEDDYLYTSFNTDRFLSKYNMNKRMEILSKEITFWRNIILVYKPDYIINETVTIEISEVLAIEASKKNIPYFSFLPGLINGYFYWKPNPFDGTININQFKENNNKYRDKTIEYINRLILLEETPYYIKNIIKNKYSLKSLFGETYRGLIKRIIYFIDVKLKNDFIYEDYKDFHFQYLKNYFNISFFSKNYDINTFSSLNNYIFYPLHYEPEATLNYFSEYYSNQPSTIENISKCLKTDQFLVVKEHPQQYGMLLTKKYRLIKKRNPNILFLPSEISSFQVIKNCESIITLTSTAAWEGLLLGKPIIVLGKIFYNLHPQASNITTFDEIKDIIRKNKYKNPQKEDTLVFIDKMLSIHYEGIPFPNKHFNIKENIKLFTKAIESHILKLD